MYGLATLFVAQVATAAPVTVNQQLRVTDAFGAPIEAETDVTVRIWSSETGGAQRHEELFTLTPTGGYASVVLGADSIGNPLDSEDLLGGWVEVVAGTTVLGARQPIGTMPLAGHALVTDSVRTAAAAPPCTTNSVGGTYYDTAQGLLKVCIGGGVWMPAVTGRHITQDTTLTIGPSGANYPDLATAMTDLQSVSIAPGALLTLSITPGTYSHSSVISLEHANGDRLRIEGNPSNPASVVLSFTGTTDGLSVPTGYALHSVDGLTIHGNGTSSRYGVIVTGFVQTVGPDLAIDGFISVGVYVVGGDVRAGSVAIEGVPGAAASNGVIVSNAGRVMMNDVTVNGVSRDCVATNTGAYAALAGLSVSNCGRVGAYARTGSMLYMPNSTVTTTGSYGISAAEASQISAASLTLSGTANSCVVAVENGYIEVTNPAAVGGVLPPALQDCGLHGVHASYGGYVDPGGSKVSNVGGSVFYATYGGTIDASAMSVDGTVPRYVNERSTGGQILAGGQVITATPSLGVSNANTSFNTQASASGTCAAASDAGTLRWTGSVLEVCTGAANVWQPASGARAAFYARAISSNAQSQVPILFNGEIFDDGGVFNPSTGEFTAPIAGLYQFSFNVQFGNGTTTGNYVYCGVQANTIAAPTTWAGLNGTTWVLAQFTNVGDNSYEPCNGTQVVHLAAGQKVRLISGAYSTVDAPLYAPGTFFTGMLVQAD